jgi:ribosome-interacting GTPase 1
MVQKELKEGKFDATTSFFTNGHIGSMVTPVKKGLMKKSKIEKRIMNTNIWNNVRVSAESGYTIEMLKSCLYNLSKFIEEYLEPNKLKYFDVECIN